jgi:hypothetical protein
MFAGACRGVLWGGGGSVIVSGVGRGGCVNLTGKKKPHTERGDRVGLFSLVVLG